VKNNIHPVGTLLLGLCITASAYAGEDIFQTTDGGLTSTSPDSWNYCGSNNGGEILAGPQSPRDIDSRSGSSTTMFKTSYNTSNMNLCNIHFHWNAEHKSEAYSTFVDTGNEHSGWAIVQPASIDPEYRATHDISRLLDGDDVHETGVIPGDTIEVHWVYTSCNVHYEELEPSKGLGNCSSEVCANPQLRVVAQVFKVAEDGATVTTMQQPMSHYDSTVVYTGSTTGEKYNNDHCSPFQVTWDVKKSVATIDAHALAEWAHEMGEHGHGVRELVTRDELLSPISSIRDRDRHDD